MSRVGFAVEGTRLLKTESNMLTPKGQHFLKAGFSFSSEWEELLKTAVFKKGDFEIDIDVTGGECEIPWEITKEEGEASLIVIGTGHKGEIAVTNSVGFNISAAGDMYMVKDYVQTV